MILSCLASVPLRKQAAALPKSTILYPGKSTQGVPRKFTVEGSFDPVLCATPKVQVTYYDAAGNKISIDGPVDASVEAGSEFWSATFSAPDNAVTANIDTLCGAVIQNSADDIQFAALAMKSQSVLSVVQERLSDDGATFTLEFSIDYPQATGFDQSEVLVIHRVIGFNQYDWFAHQFTPNPPLSKRTFTINDADPGRYVIKFAFVNGTKEVDQYMQFFKIPASA